MIKTFVLRILTGVGLFGYAFLVTAKSVTGFDIPIRRRTHRHHCFSGGFFVSVAWRSSFFGRAMRGAARLAGPSTGMSTRMVPPFLRLTSQGREIFQISFEGACA
ncbi:MAG: hypothetical protein VR65_06115 [Desulfobulbaceae bacterium BRH_c16a]|nr:MAG: hypothetical protein VR65_06115 [Desulfobulbaceae bacterium BRH_c16a]